MISPIENSALAKKLLMTADEACQALSVCRKTLYTLTKKGGLKVVPIGKKGIRFSVADLEAWIASQSQEAATP